MEETQDEIESCACCGGIQSLGTSIYPVCTECLGKYPPSLVKACCDQFDYALGLRDGRVLRFSLAKVKGDWVTIHAGFSEEDFRGQNTPGRFPFPRGIDIRLDDIVWCADAPEGS